MMGIRYHLLVSIVFDILKEDAMFVKLIHLFLHIGLEQKRSYVHIFIHVLSPPSYYFLSLIQVDQEGQTMF